MYWYSVLYRTVFQPADNVCVNIREVSSDCPLYETASTTNPEDLHCDCFIDLVFKCRPSSFMFSGKFSIGYDRLCLPLARNVDGINIMANVSIIGVMFYVASIAMYIHIYYDNKRTVNKTPQIRTENRLARKIALIIFTNILFFMVPLISTGIISFSSIRQSLSHFVLYIYWDTVLITCLGINSMLNPILFSLRNEKFQREFRKHCLCYRQVARLSRSSRVSA